MAIITVIRIILSEAKSWPCCVLSLLLGGGPHTENFSNSSWSKYCQPKATEYPNHHLLLLLLTSVVCLSLKTPLNYKAFPHRISHRKLTWIKKDSEWVGLEIRLARTQIRLAQGAQMLAHGPTFAGPLPVTVHCGICRADVLRFSYWAGTRWLQRYTNSPSKGIAGLRRPGLGGERGGRKREKKVTKKKKKKRTC